MRVWDGRRAIASAEKHLRLLDEMRRKGRSPSGAMCFMLTSKFTVWYVVWSEHRAVFYQSHLPRRRPSNQHAATAATEFIYAREM